MISLATADNALKDVYLGVVSDQLNTTVNPLLSKITLLRFGGVITNSARPVCWMM